MRVVAVVILLVVSTEINIASVPMFTLGDITTISMTGTILAPCM